MAAPAASTATTVRRARRPAARAGGFTLIEVLVVTVLVGAVLVAVTLSLSGSGARELEASARRTEALVRLACERAELTGLDIGWRIEPDGIVFGPLRDTGWEPLRDDRGDELRPRNWDRGIAVEVWREGLRLDPAADPRQPQLACLASGELSPFVLEMVRAGVEGGWRLRGELAGTLVLEQFDAPAR